MLSHGHKRSQHFPRNPAFSRAQARSAPRAHVRELLCVPQSSKERLRRSRTESSAAPPATEELAGEARQVRPARAACGSVSTDFGLLTGGEVRRAPGPPAPATNLSSQKPNIPPQSCFAPHRSLMITNNANSVSKKTTARYKKRYRKYSRQIKTLAHNERERKNVKIKEYFRNRRTTRFASSWFCRR